MADLDDHERRLRMLEAEVFGGNAYAVSEFDRIALSIQRAYGLSRSKTMILRHLLLVDVATFDRLSEIVEANSGHGKLPSRDQVRTVIATMRATLAPRGITILSVPTVGFTLSSACKTRLMKAAGISLRGAAWASN